MVIDSKFIRFIFVGMLNTGFGFGLFSVLILLSAHYSMALLVAFVCGVVFNFFTTGQLIFKTSNPRKFPAFATVYLAMYLLNLAALSILINTGISPFIAQGACTIVIALLTFYLLKRIFE